MSHFVGKPTMWFPNRSDTNRPVQLQKQARSLKVWDYVEKDFSIREAKTKVLISFSPMQIVGFPMGRLKCSSFALGNSIAPMAEWFRALNHSTISPLCLV